MTTIVTSRVGVIIDALVAALQASPIFADPLRVYDGPTTTIDTMFTSAVFVGFNGDWSAHPDYESVTFDQSLNYLGNTSMFEQFDVLCCAQGWSGDPNVTSARDQALAMFTGVQTVLRTDETLGIGDGSTVAALKIAGSLRYEFDNDGNIAARIPFQIHVITTLLTTS